MAGHRPTASGVRLERSACPLPPTRDLLSVRECFEPSVSADRRSRDIRRTGRPGREIPLILPAILPRQTLHSRKLPHVRRNQRQPPAQGLPRYQQVDRLAHALQSSANLPACRASPAPNSSTRAGPLKNISNRRVFASVCTLWATPYHSSNKDIAGTHNCSLAVAALVNRLRAASDVPLISAIQIGVSSKYATARTSCIARWVPPGYSQHGSASDAWRQSRDKCSAPILLSCQSHA
jgi:hypothetical protein